MYVVYLLYFLSIFFCLLTIKICFPPKKLLIPCYPKCHPSLIHYLNECFQTYFERKIY